MRNPLAIRSQLRWLRTVAVAFALVVGILSDTPKSTAFDHALVQQIASKSHAGRSRDILTAWLQLLSEARDLPEQSKLRVVNDFFNRNIRFEDDQALWGQADYWASPLETLSAGAGDCEDFSIAKYFTLKAIGIPTVRLRLIYVRAQIGGPASGISQAHMILAYYSSPDSEPLVLDSLISEIRSASRRVDLSPVFSFNSDGIWPGAGTGHAADTSRLSRWRDLLARARKEGFG